MKESSRCGGSTHGAAALTALQGDQGVRGTRGVRLGQRDPKSCSDIPICTDLVQIRHKRSWGWSPAGTGSLGAWG